MVLELENPRKEKKDPTISVRFGETQYKEVIQNASECGFEDVSEYVRAALYFAKPVMLRLKNDPSFVLSIIARMVKVN